MHFKWILLISSCLILSASSARKRGGGSRSSSGPRGVIRGATSYTRPSTRVLSGSPRVSSSPRVRGRGPRPRTSHAPRAASAPPLSSLPHSPNSLHVPRPASAPPLSSLPPLSKTPKTGPGIPKPPPLPPNSFNHVPPKKSVSGIPPAPPLAPPPPPKSNLPQNVPKSGTGPAVMTPLVVSPIMRIPQRRNTTTNGNSTNTKNPNRNHSKPGSYPGGNTTAQANLSKLNPLHSSKNTTKSGGVIGNSTGRNVTGNAKLNGTVNGFPQVSSGKITNRNFTLSSNGIKVLNSSRLANHTRHNNTRNATGNVFQADVTPISQTQPSPIGKFPSDTVMPGNPQQTTNNNMSPLDNSAENYDANNGDAPRKTRKVIGDLAKRIIKGVAAKQNNGVRSANLNSGLNGQSWDNNRNEFVKKSSPTSKPPSKSIKNKIIIITVLVSIVLIASGVILYFCNRK